VRLHVARRHRLVTVATVVHPDLSALQATPICKRVAHIGPDADILYLDDCATQASARGGAIGGRERRTPDAITAIVLNRLLRRPPSYRLYRRHTLKHATFRF
jgi:hypothetical protein